MLLAGPVFSSLLFYYQTCSTYKKLSTEFSLRKTKRGVGVANAKLEHRNFKKQLFEIPRAGR